MNIRQYKECYWLLLLLLFLQGCSGSQKEEDNHTNTIMVGKGFSSKDINGNVLICRKFNVDELKKGVEKRIFQNFSKNDSRETVIYGSSYQQHYGWAYFTIVNTSDISQELVIETNHIRCDGFGTYLIKKEKIIASEKVERNMPIAQRKYPFLDFALPIHILPRDTLGVLVWSKRLSAINEVNLQLYSREAFLSMASSREHSGVFQVTSTFTIMMIVFMIGVIFRQQLLLDYAFFLLGVSLMLCNSSYLFDLVRFPKASHVNASNMGSFLTFLTNAIFHPFGYRIVRGFKINHQRYLLGAKILVTLNCMMILALSFTKEIEYILPSMFLLLMLANVSWILYYSALAYIRENIKYYFWASVVSFLPLLLKLGLNVLQIQTYRLAFNFNDLNTVVILISMMYITIEQFRNELNSKQNFEQNLLKEREIMDKLRHDEIEGVGRNLHDQVGNTLASALGYLNMKVVDVDIVKKLILNAITELRFISHNLVKDNDEPLTEKITLLVARFNDFSTIQFNFQDYSEAKLNLLGRLQQHNIYSIIQELLTNAIKHSQANEVDIQIFERDNSLQISIEDDGIGFSLQQKSKGIGIHNIYKRASLMNLNIEINSSKYGTSIIIEVPYQDKRSHH